MRGFPPAEGSGLIVLSAPHQEQFERLLKEVDRVLFRAASDTRKSIDRIADAVARPQAARAHGLEGRTVSLTAG
jgi:hypothetical protein